jgi:hypothetical protein
MNHPFDDNNMTAVKRGMDRDSLLLKAVLRLSVAQDEREVRIRNLSAGGLMAEVPIQVSRGEAVEVHLRSIGWITGHIAWVTEGRVGIAFDHPINPKDARKPVSATESELPNYLKKLNVPIVPPSKLRRV